MAFANAKKSWQYLAAGALLLLSRPALGMGLRTQFGEVRVKNLFIGQTYSLNKLLNLPLRVVNTGSEPVDLQMDVLLPPANEVPEGFSAVPSTSWVTLDKVRHLGVLPGQEAVSDVIIRLPDDPAIMGRGFKVYLWSHTINRFGIAAALESTLYIQVASRPPGEEEKLRSQFKRRLANVNFSIMPDNALVSDVPVGRVVDLKKEFKVAIKLVNPNDQKVTFHLAPKSAAEASVGLVDGFDTPPNVSVLKLKKELLEVEANSIGEAEMVLDIPDFPGSYGKSWMFVVSADLLEQEIPTHFNYRLLVTTAKKAQDSSGTKKEDKK